MSASAVRSVAKVQCRIQFYRIRDLRSSLDDRVDDPADVRAADNRSLGLCRPPWVILQRLLPSRARLRWQPATMPRPAWSPIRSIRKRRSGLLFRSLPPSSQADWKRAPDKRLDAHRRWRRHTMPQLPSRPPECPRRGEAQWTRQSRERVHPSSTCCRYARGSTTCAKTPCAKAISDGSAFAKAAGGR